MSLPNFHQSENFKPSVSSPRAENEPTALKMPTGMMSSAADNPHKELPLVTQE